MIVKKEYGLFRGNISLENNGGFSSVYRPINRLHNDVKKVHIKIKGDGQKYQLRLILSVGGYNITYRHEFVTLKHIEEKVSFDFTDFTATFRGRLLPNAPVVRPENIKEIGFLMSKKTAGEFALKISEININ